jgi:ASC-1-like (ASCH) protein
VALGDRIIFTLSDDQTQSITVEVVGLLRYATFAAMFARNDPRKFGGSTAPELTKALEKYYSPEAQAENGVLGIEVQRV